MIRCGGSYLDCDFLGLRNDPVVVNVVVNVVVIVVANVDHDGHGLNLNRQ